MSYFRHDGPDFESCCEINGIMHKITCKSGLIKSENQDLIRHLRDSLKLEQTYPEKIHNEPKEEKLPDQVEESVIVKPRKKAVKE